MLCAREVIMRLTLDLLGEEEEIVWVELMLHVLVLIYPGETDGACSLISLKKIVLRQSECATADYENNVQQRDTILQLLFCLFYIPFR